MHRSVEQMICDPPRQGSDSGSDTAGSSVASAASDSEDEPPGLFGLLCRCLEQHADKHAEKHGYQDELAWAKQKGRQAKEKLGEELEKKLVSADDNQVNRILDTALDAGLTGKYAPAAIRAAAAKSASARLRSALQGGEAKALKGAMIAAQKLHATEVPEYEQAVQIYATLRKFPPGWSQGLALQRHGGKFVAKKAITDTDDLDMFQQLLDLTHKKVYTRDRQGVKVPDGFQLTSAMKVENADKWVDYMTQQEIIRQEISSDPSGFVTYDVDTMTEDTEEIAAWLTEFAGTPPLDANVNEVWLFHGTAGIAADKITSNEFRINLAGSNAGTLYGRGIYLADSASKSDEYAQADKSGEFTLLLCRATLGRVYYTDAVVVDPRQCEDKCLKGKYNSIFGDREKARGTFHEFVLFDDAQVYSNYILKYKRVFA